MANSSVCPLAPLCLSRDPTCGLLRRTFPFPVPCGPEPILLLLLGVKAYGLKSVAVLLQDLNVNAMHEGGRDERSVSLIHGSNSGLELSYLMANLAHGLPRTMGAVWLHIEGWGLRAPGRLAHVSPYVTRSSIRVWVIGVLHGRGS